MLKQGFSRRSVQRAVRHRRVFARLAGRFASANTCESCASALLKTSVPEHYCIDQLIFKSAVHCNAVTHISPGCNPGDGHPVEILALKGRLMMIARLSQHENRPSVKTNSWHSSHYDDIFSFCLAKIVDEELQGLSIRRDFEVN